jgi:hypothetical protein
MSDKHEPAKATHTPAKDEPEKTSHQAAVAEGVKAAESHRQTTKDVVETEHEPAKAPKPHPHMAKMAKLLDEVAAVAKKHKEEVLDLREKLQALLFEAPADMPGQSQNSFQAMGTQIESGLNMLDPDCSARAPG